MIVVALLLLALLGWIVLQPFVLQLACALGGVKPPSLGTAVAVVAVTFVVGTVVSGLWGATGAWLLSGIHPGLGIASSLAVSALVMATVASAFLRVSLGDGAKVALITHGIGWLVAALVAGAAWAGLALG